MKVYIVVETSVWDSIPSTKILFSTINKKEARKKLSKIANKKIADFSLDKEGLEIWRENGSYFYNLSIDRFFMYSSENILLRNIAIEVMEIEL